MSPAAGLDFNGTTQVDGISDQGDAMPDGMRLVGSLEIAQSLKLSSDLLEAIGVLIDLDGASGHGLSLVVLPQLNDSRVHAPIGLSKHSQVVHPGQAVLVALFQLDRWKRDLLQVGVLSLSHGLLLNSACRVLVLNLSLGHGVVSSLRLPIGSDSKRRLNDMLSLYV